MILFVISGFFALSIRGQFQRDIVKISFVGARFYGCRFNGRTPREEPPHRPDPTSPDDRKSMLREKHVAIIVLICEMVTVGGTLFLHIMTVLDGQTWMLMDWRVFDATQGARVIVLILDFCEVVYWWLDNSLSGADLSSLGTRQIVYFKDTKPIVSYRTYFSSGFSLVLK